MNPTKDPVDAAMLRPAVVRASKAHRILDVGPTLFWEIRKRPDFPRPVLIGGQAKGYLVREIEEWAASALPRG